MNAGREHLSAVVTENATEDKALGKLRTDEDICYWTSRVSKRTDEEETSITSLLSYEETEDKKLCPACSIS